MSVEEKTVLYYIANLILISRHNIIKIICERNLILMNKASSLFKANVSRYLALCLIRNYTIGEESQFEEERIMSLLEDSY